MAIRVVKEMAEEPLGLAFSSGQYRGHTLDTSCILYTPCILYTSCIHARRGSCIHPTSSLSDKSSSKENSENNPFSHCASAESKTVPSRDSHIGFKGWVKIVGNALMKLCYHDPSTKKPHLRKNSEFPTK